MRRFGVLGFLLVAGMLSWRLLSAASGSGSFTPVPGSLVALYNGQNGDGVYAIGAATSTDGGATWTKYGSNPVLQKGTGGAWDDDHVKDPWLMWDGSQYVVYYAGHDGTKYQIGRATASAHTGTWTKAGGNPLVAVGTSGAFDDAGVNFPTVLYEPSDTGREWKMWYAGNDGAVQRIGYAYSSDGLSWTKHGQVIDVGAGGSWEDEGVLPMAIHKTGSTYYLFYGGRQGTTVPRWQGGIATFTNPEGTYTKSGSNPVLLARFNDADTSQLLTANRTSGGAIVTVTDTSVWNVGEPLALADGTSETEIHAIASIDSGTQITLAGNVTSDFTTAHGATIRPMAWNAVLPRTVRAVSGGYEMYGTPFQPVEDLSPGGTKLREGSMRWTASALTGPWAYDYDAGLLFPLFPANTGWDKFSAENPSVIVAP